MPPQEQHPFFADLLSREELAKLVQKAAEAVCDTGPAASTAEISHARAKPKPAPKPAAKPKLKRSKNARTATPEGDDLDMAKALAASLASGPPETEAMQRKKQRGETHRAYAGGDGRRRDCHFDDTPFSSILKTY